MTALLDMLEKMNVNEDDTQELAVRAVRDDHHMGYNAVFNSFKLTLSTFSLSEERRLQQGIKDDEQKLG